MHNPIGKRNNGAEPFHAWRGWVQWQMPYLQWPAGGWLKIPLYQPGEHLHYGIQAAGIP